MTPQSYGRCFLYQTKTHCLVLQQISSELSRNRRTFLFALSPRDLAWYSWAHALRGLSLTSFCFVLSRHDWHTPRAARATALPIRWFGRWTLATDASAVSGR